VQNPTLAIFAAAPPVVWLPLVILLLVLGPLMEELLFRGWLLGGLRERMGDGWALLLTSLLFALGHLSLWNAPGHFLGGLILGWVALRSGSITTSLALHSLWNLTWLIRVLAQLP
jgi:membrane protease YdiL (CAAX protease family)